VFLLLNFNEKSKKMKSKTSIIVVLSILFLCGLCKKDDNTSNSSGGSGIMTATIDGSSWSANASMLYYLDVDAPVGATIIGQSVPDAKEIYFHFPGKIAVGTFTITASSSGVTAYFADTPNKIEYNAISGTIAITKKENDKISGTFNFIGQLDGGSATIAVDGVFSDVKKTL
jgi:hypothetical protein